MFSIVIPSKNEEKQIGNLLASIRDQTVQPQKIVLADKSTDHTRKIARAYNVEIVDGIDTGYIGKARNIGSLLARSNIIVFLDADTELPVCTFIEDALTCFEALELDIASCYYKPAVLNWKSFLMFGSINICKWFDNYIQTGITSGGGFIMVKKSVFERVGKFREDIKVSEDQELFWRVLHSGYRYKVLPLTLAVSSRRFTEVSPSLIIRSIIGGLGTISINVFKIPLLKKFRKNFETWYGETGGSVDR